MSRLAAAVLAAVLANTARAADLYTSPISGSFELQAGQYLPDIDSEPGLTAKPWEDAFGKSKGWMFRGGASWAPYHGWGTLEIGGQVGYFQKNGFGQLVGGGGQSGDVTKFHMIPTSATLTYRFDTLGRGGYALPLAPYVRVALERYNWWATDGGGKTSMSGGTNGWSAAGGLALLLDFIDPALGRELDRETGINHSYVFAEARKAVVDDFGSQSSWILTDKANISWSFGLLFVY